MHNDQSSLSSAGNFFRKKGVALALDLLCTLFIGLVLAQAAGATTISMWLRMTTSQARSPCAGTCTPSTVMTVDVSIAQTRAIPFLPPFPLQWQEK